MYMVCLVRPNTQYTWYVSVQHSGYTHTPHPSLVRLYDEMMEATTQFVTQIN